MCVGVGGSGSSLCPVRHVVACGGLVGLLFEICIVDASIKYTFVVICFDVVETSYEGHTVDALASRADEGRRSLR